MAVELLGYSTMGECRAVQEAATAGLRAMEHLLLQISSSSSSPNKRSVDCSDLASDTVCKFRKVISILDRTGHARFRRGPISSSTSSASTSTSSGPLHDLNSPPPDEPSPSPSPSFSFPKAGQSLSFTGSLSASFSSSITGAGGEGSVNGKAPSPFPLPSAVKPPKCPGRSHSTFSDRCHCSKKRKSRVKKTIRVPSPSSKIADIPPDDFSWRKYGQKPIKGSPFPRSYYKCSTLRGCPAKKHVERAPEDPSILIITYDGEHQHAAAPPRGLAAEI